MKIAAIGDAHLGYPRFYEDSFIQARAAFADADKKADLILFLGDLYDSRVPSLQVLGEAISLFRTIKTPVFTIHGNHERRSRGALNPVELLEKAGLVKHLHMNSKVFEKEGEKVFVAGIGNVPDDLAPRALGKLKECIAPPKDMFSILLLHQSFGEFVYGDNLASLNDLEGMGYSLYLNGHVHAHKVGMEGRFIIPGSTVLTQLTREEEKPKGYVLYDTIKREHEFVETESRKFILEEMEFGEAAPEFISKSVLEKAEALRAAHAEAVIKLKVRGSLKTGFRASDIRFPHAKNLYIDNGMDEASLGRDMEKVRRMREEKLPVRDISERRLREKMEGKVSLFEPAELFERLLEGPQEAREYLKGERCKRKL